MRLEHVGWTSAVLLAALLLAACGGPDTGSYEKAWLEEVEDLAESLANDLLALSVAVRDRDTPSIGRYFTDKVTAPPLPVVAEPLEPIVKWVHRHGWSAKDETARTVSRDELLDEINAWLDHFSEIEDVRFKTKGAEFDPARPGEGSGRIKLFIIGRDPDGHREWLRAWYRMDVRRAGDEEPWQIARLEIESIDSEVATKDLFSEIAAPAGVSVLHPPFGVPPNEGFVSHGAAVADVDLDGLLDIAASGVEQNHLYLNRGDGGFEDASEASLVKFAPIGSGALFVDHDNDGDPDLFFAAVGRQVLLENRIVPDGELAFWDVSEKAGVNLSAVGFSAAAADVDGNGFTDIYVASYNRYGTVMPDSWNRATNGTPNLLFLNQGDGTFLEKAAAMGVNDGRWTYAAAFADLDADGDQDLYVSNDFGENAFYRNDGDGFTETAAAMGVVDPGFGMGVSYGDYDNDGDLDLHVTNMSSTAGNRILKRLYPEEGHDLEYLSKLAAGNSLYENRGDGTFVDVTEEAGGFSGGWAFGGGFIDFDNDGWEDVYTPNGFISGKSMKDT